MKASTRYSVFVVVFALLLILSIHGVNFIPAWNFRGLDFQNLHTFHHRCPEWPIPYLKSGAECGDPLGRAMLYPPLIYWVMAWTRVFPFYLAEILWSLAIPLFVVFAGWIVNRADRTETEINTSVSVAVLWGLTFLQMPMIYAIERGNNDAAVIPVFALAILFFTREKFFWSGAMLAASCWMKVYPVIPSFLILGALAFQDDRRAKFIPMLKGFVIAGMVLLLVLLPDSWIYIFTILPGVANDPGGFGTSSHTLYKGFPSLFLKIPLLFLWGYSMKKLIRRDPVLMMAAGLAIATFFQNLSNDYNLITVYPFLFILLKRLFRPGMDWMDFGILVLTFAALVGDRTPLETIFPNRSALFLQIFWFTLFPSFLMLRREAK